jgi:hypothetical protein
MKNKIIICLLFILAAIKIQAQVVIDETEKINWFFGRKAGMTWKKTQDKTVSGHTLRGLPTPLNTSQMETKEGCFTVSDPNGELLMYSDGMSVWNGEHEKIIDNELAGDTDSSQSGIVIPYPGKPNWLIVLAMSMNYDDYVNGVNIRGNRLTYTIIDVSKKTPGKIGYGAVVGNYKNIELTGAGGKIGECVSAVRASDNESFWIVAIGKGLTTYMNAWKVTAKDGVIANSPEKTAIGSSTSTSTGSATYDNTAPYGHLKLSPVYTLNTYTKKFVWSENITTRTFIGEFSTSTGKCTSYTMFYASGNANTINEGVGGFYGAEFSPNGANLFLSKYGELRVYKTRDLYITANGSTPAASKSWPSDVSGLQIGPDHRIYGSHDGEQSLMMVISNPDEANSGSIMVDNVPGLFYPGTRGSEAALPNFLTGPLKLRYYKINIEGVDELCMGDNDNTSGLFKVDLTNVMIQDANKIEWKFDNYPGWVDGGTFKPSGVNYSPTLPHSIGSSAVEVRIYNTANYNANNSDFLIASAAKMVTVKDCGPKIIGITGNKNICLGNQETFSVSLTGITGATYVRWDFGDGSSTPLTHVTTSGSLTPAHTYYTIRTSNNPYTVTVNIYDASGTKIIAIGKLENITVWSCMTVSIDKSEDICLGSDKTFMVKTINSVSGAKKIRWTFGSANPVTVPYNPAGTNQSPVFHPTSTGSYPIKAEVLGPNNELIATSPAFSVTVKDCLTISISGNADICLGSTEEFTVTLSSTAGVSKIRWNFGNGSQPVEDNVNGTTVKRSYKYLTQGSYKITAEAIDASGNVKAADTRGVTVNMCSIPVNPRLRGHIQ